MKMLPITDQNLEFDSKFITVYCVGTTQISLKTTQLFAIKNRIELKSGLIAGELADNTSAAFITETFAEHQLLERSDAVVFVIDAELGVSPKSIDLWKQVAELDIPQIVVATNLFATHTDFDEVVAICNRVFDPDLLIRFLPMSDDNETEIVGQFDLLLNRILDYSSETEVHTVPDPEHLELTTDQREALIELLAYQGLSDGLLEMYQSGIKPTTEQILGCWLDRPQKTVIALDRLAGLTQVTDWLNSIDYRWLPFPESDDHDTHSQFPSFYGFGVSRGLARYWGRIPTEIEISGANDQTEILTHVKPFTSCLISDEIDDGDILHLPGKPIELSFPIFD